jgi:hypothetical protein
VNADGVHRPSPGCDRMRRCESRRSARSTTSPTNEWCASRRRDVYHEVDAEIFDVPNATSTLDLLAKVAAVYQGYLGRNFPERAAALAAEIDAERPDLIGLGSNCRAYSVTAGRPGDVRYNCGTRLRAVLLDALAARQEAQAAEVSAGPGATELPLILVGDLNSPADGSGVT